jgi:FKBP-type peptidyl-prolyl cis-trans isomerase FkpA
MEEFRPKIQALVAARQSAQAANEKQKGQEFVAKALAEGGTKTDNGAVYQILREGTGPMPTATDTVSVHYTGTLTNGTVFDSSVQRGTPATFPLNGVIPCWTEGLQKLKVGGKMKLNCPSDIAYGDRGRPPQIPGGATLVFEVELLEITTPPAAPQQ